jgi:hypothetical protein
MRISRSMSDQHELEERVKTAQAECERLRKENVRLRAMLGFHDPVPETSSPVGTRLYANAFTFPQHHRGFYT